MARKGTDTRNDAVRANLDPALGRWRSDYAFSTTVSAVASLGITTLFALYNGFLGIKLTSLWNGGICVYYLLLVGIRGTLLLKERKLEDKGSGEKARGQKKALLVSAIMLLALNLALIYPITVMARLERVLDIGRIPAIAMAAYTTYKITMAAIHMRKRNKVESIDPLVRELRTISFVDALVSILVLQNTLIITNATEADLQSMLALSSISSAAVYIAVVSISIRSLRSAVKLRRT